MNGPHPNLLKTLVKGDNMSHQQFEKLREQLKLLSNQQLKALKGEISSQLEPTAQSLLNDDEMQALSQLFK